MPNQETHPSSATLHAFGLGQLAIDEATEIERHLCDCETCCATVADLSSNDTFIGLLQTAEREAGEMTVDHRAAVVANLSSSVPDPIAEHPRYEVLGLIGRGGMGDVYKARHRKMDRTVALKVIRRELVRKPDAVERFQREVTAAARLSHTNIVTAYDADQAAGYHFMVMEYVDGVDLSRIVNERGRLAISEACDYIRQVAIGLQHAHEQGMVHRDIKPHNLMVTAEGTLKILDFGLASLAPQSGTDCDTVEARGDLTAIGSVMGTPDYISPEQAVDAHQADIRSDIYSLGASLYYLLAGHAPFSIGSVTQKLKHHAELEPESLATIRSDIPAELLDIVSKMMAKDPEQRFQTPSQVAAALRRFGSRRTASQPTGNRTKPLHPVRFIGSSVIAAGLLLMTLAAGLVYVLQSGSGVLRVEVAPQETKTTLGTHSLTIVDDSGKPYGGTSGTHRNDVTGETSHSFKSANGRYKIKLVGDVLTINGDRYTIQNASDRIRVIGDRVEITRVETPSKENAIASAAGDAGQRDANDSVDGSDEQPDSDDVAMLKFLYKDNPELAESIAKKMLESGNEEAAKSILRYVHPDDPQAKALIELAKIYDQKGDHESAGKSYLEAYRIQPSTLSDAHLKTLKKAGLTHELVDFYTEANLKRLGYVDPSPKVVEFLLRDEATRADGYRLLRRVWNTRQAASIELADKLDQAFWDQVPDPAGFLRAKLLPTDFAVEGSGWDRFAPQQAVFRPSTNDSYVRGPLQSLRPLLNGTARQNSAAKNVATEVRDLLKKNPRWNAGVAVLGFLEANLGNEQQAIELFERVLAQEQGAIPPDVAWGFGLALEGKGKMLDQTVIRLYEKKLAAGAGPRTLRYTPLRNLGPMYVKRGRADQARRQLLSLAKPETRQRCTPGFQAQNKNRCTECHRQEQSLYNFTGMACLLSSVGAPVDAYLQLARIDASFGNLFTSDAKWVESKKPRGLDANYLRGIFQQARRKAVGKITPEAILKALQRGVFLDDEENQAFVAPSAESVDLMLSVRGEGGRSILFSPILEVLAMAANKTEGQSQSVIDDIDRLLAEASKKKPHDLELGIVSTAFAFQRKDFEVALQRMNELRKQQPSEQLSKETLGLWFIARFALASETTSELGRYFAECALAAAENQPDRIWKDAMVEESEQASRSQSSH